MEGQRLVRRCLTLPLAETLSLITMLCLYVGFHGAHASHSETICPTGQAHLIMFVDMVVRVSLLVDQNAHRGQKFAST